MSWINPHDNYLTGDTSRYNERIRGHYPSSRVLEEERSARSTVRNPHDQEQAKARYAAWDRMHAEQQAEIKRLTGMNDLERFGASGLGLTKEEIAALADMPADAPLSEADIDRMAAIEEEKYTEGHAPRPNVNFHDL